MSRPKNYETGIAHMRKMERAQAEMRRTLQLSVVCPTRGLRYDAVQGRPIEGGSTIWYAPAATQSVLQRELTRNARQLTHMHVALAFCRNRLRRGAPRAEAAPFGALDWIRVLSKDCGWTNLDAVRAQYERWANWCNVAEPVDRKPPFPAVAWQREFLSRERKARQARKAARKAAQGRVPDPMNAICAEAVAEAACMSIEQVAALFPEPQP